MQVAKSIDEIYREVKGYDLVITNDAPLASALNAMMDKAFVGNWAMTPKQIASLSSVEMTNEAVVDELVAIRMVAEETGFDFRRVHSEIELIKDIYKYTSEVEQHLSPTGKKIFRSYDAITTIEKALTSFEPARCSLYKDKDKGIVLIDPMLFNNLDKCVTPENYKEIEVTRYDEMQLDRVYMVGNDRQVAENALEIVKDCDPLDVAIVLDTDSAMADAVRTALYRRDIPFINSLDVRDINAIRDFIEFVRLSLSYDILRVADIREVFSSLYVAVPSKSDEHLLSRETFENAKADRYRRIMEGIRDRTFSQVVDEVFVDREGRMVKVAGVIRTVIQDLGLEDEKVTEKKVNMMLYAIDNVSDLHHNEQIPDNEKRGVLIADCKRSVFVDRPIVLYLGMEQDWDIDLVDRTYIKDLEGEFERNAYRFQIMLQQGQRRFYLTNRTKNGRSAQPAAMFSQITGRPVRKFSEVFGEVREGRWYDAPPASIGRRVPIPNAGRYDAGFSQARFCKYVQCPRMFMYDTLLSSSDKAIFEFGNILHEFAEMYVCHRDLVDRTIEEKGLDHFVDVAADRYAGLSSPLLAGMDRSRIRFAMENIMRFVKDRDIRVVNDVGFSEKRRNYMCERCFNPGLTQTSSACETDRQSSEHRIHGKMDLFYEGSVYDYKTGKLKTGKEKAKEFNMDKIDKYPDFQPLFYLALAREIGGGNTDFNLFYAMFASLLKVKVMGDDEALGSPEATEAFGVSSRGALHDYPNEFVDALLEMAPGNPDDWDSVALSKPLINEMKSRIKKTIRDETMKNGIDRYRDIVKGGLMVGETVIAVTDGYLNGFLAKVDAMHAEMSNASIAEGGLMPVKGDRCADCDFRSVCTIDAEVDSDE